MVLTNTSVSHLSPMLIYIPALQWFEGTADDPSLGNYPTQSYHATNSSAAQGSVVLEWYGQGGLWIFGAHRSRLGPYKVTVDGTTSLLPGFNPGDTEDFHAVLFQQTNLAPGYHQVEIANMGQDPSGNVLDIVNIVFENDLGSPTRIPETFDGCVWLPRGGGWSSDSNTHTTYDSSGSMQVNFTGKAEFSGSESPRLNDPCFPPCQGSAVQLWGPPSLSPNSHVQAYNSSNTNTPHLLFAQYNLTEGTHLFEIRNNPRWTNSSEAATTLSISYLTAFALPNSAISKSNIAVSIIVGTSIAGFCLLVFTLWSIWFCNKRAKQNKANREKYKTSPFFGLLWKPSNRPTGMASLLGHSDGSGQRRRDGRTDGSQGEGIRMNPLKKELSISSSRSSSSGTSSVGGTGVAMQDNGKGKMKDDEVSTLNYSIIPNPPSSPPAHFPFHPARFTRTYPPSHSHVFQSAPPAVTNFSSPPRSDRSESFSPEDLILEQILIIGDPTKSASSTPEPSFRSPTASSIFVRPLSSIAPTSDGPTRQSSIASTAYRRGRQRSTRRMTATTMATVTTYGSSTNPDLPSPPPMPTLLPISPFTPPRGYGEPLQSSPEAMNESFQDLPRDHEPELYNFPPPALPPQQHSQNHHHSPPSNLSRSRSRSSSSTSENHANAIQHSRSRSDSIPYTPPPPPITPRRPPLPTPPNQPPSMRAFGDSRSDLNTPFQAVEYLNPLGSNDSAPGLPTYGDAIGPRAQAQQVVGIGAMFTTQRNVLPQYRSPEER